MYAKELRNEIANWFEIMVDCDKVEVEQTRVWNADSPFQTKEKGELDTSIFELPPPELHKEYLASPAGTENG